MKDQLTIQELAAYLPWEVEMCGCQSKLSARIIEKWENDEFDISLILYPLSSLTNPKNGVDGITWFDDICWNFFDSRTPDNYECSKIVLNELLQAGKVQMDTYYILVEYLLKNHFDLFGLIKRGLAISK